jgi:hypothetical protein
MKQILLFLAVTIIITNSCSKGGTSPGGGNNNGGGNNGGGNTGTITVTSVTPANLYPDDQITITGTGFDPDASKDTLEFGRLTNGNFNPWHDGPQAEMASLCTVVNATTTQLVVKSVNPYNLDYSAFSQSTNSVAVIQIRTGGKKVVTPVIPFKRLLLLNFINNPDFNNNQIGRPSDSLVISGKGFAKSGVSVSIDGTSLTNFKIDSTTASGKITLRLPKTFFGNTNADTPIVDKKMTLSNPDGKTVQKTFHFLLSPFMDIYSMQTEFSSYSLAGLTSSGGVVKVFVKGRSLKDDAIVKVGGVNIQTQSALQVSGFPDNTIIILTPGSLATGNLQVSIWRGSTLYGACTFDVTQ